MKSSLRLLMAALALGAAGAASATPVTFTFNNGSAIDNKQNSFLFSVGGVNLTVTAGSNKVAYRQEGLGVFTGGADAGEFNSYAGHNGVETLTFTFDQTVTLSSISFFLFENNTDQGKLVYGSTTKTINKTSDAVFGTPVSLNSFTFTATGLFTSYRISGLQVNTVAPAVPVPAAAWLMGSGLLGLAGVARRRRSQNV